MEPTWEILNHRSKIQASAHFDRLMSEAVQDVMARNDLPALRFLIQIQKGRERVWQRRQDAVVAGAEALLRNA